MTGAVPHGEALEKPLLYLTCGVEPAVLRTVVQLAVDIARQGREGKRIGTTFVVGDEQEVLRRSHPLILDPLRGHPEAVRDIMRPGMRGTIRELAQLDGAFVISGRGIVLSATRCLDVASGSVDLPMGLGSRHRSAASMTRATGALAVVVSQSSTVRLFHDGSIVDELQPLRIGGFPMPGHPRGRRRHDHCGCPQLAGPTGPGHGPGFVP